MTPEFLKSIEEMDFTREGNTIFRIKGSGKAKDFQKKKDD